MWQTLSCSFRVGVIGMEPIAFIVLDALKRIGIGLVQDYAQDTIQQFRRLRKTFHDEALARFPPLNDEYEPVAVSRDYLIVNHRRHRRYLNDDQIISLSRDL